MALIHFQLAGKNNAAAEGVNQLGVAAQGEAAVDLIENGVAAELGGYVHIRGGAHHIDHAF